MERPVFGCQATSGSTVYRVPARAFGDSARNHAQRNSPGTGTPEVPIPSAISRGTRSNALRRVRLVKNTGFRDSRKSILP
ncbi:hypothetical protein Are01nite_11330 [Actinoplanes regularis]|nr:hypothetical protein Are01nite_11330 [Actinoplanes regularis]